MYVCCSRDIQNMKEKRGTYWRLFKDQWSFLSLVRATRSWAEWQNCLSKSSHQPITGYGNVQFLPQNHLVLLHVFDFLSSGTGDHHPHLSLPCNELICLNRTGHMRTMKGEHPTGAGGMVTKGAGHDTRGGKIAMEKQAWRAGRYVDSSFGPRLESETVSPCPLWAALASCMDLQHYCFLVL